MQALATSEQALFERFFAYYASSHPFATREAAQLYFEHIEDKSALATGIDRFEKLSKRAAQTPHSDAGAFRHKVAAWGIEGGLIIGMEVDVHAPALGKRFRGYALGLFGSPFNTAGGELYYDDAADLDGKCDIHVGFFSAYQFVNFLRNNRVFATFQAGGLPNLGMLGGQGDWSKE